MTEEVVVLSKSDGDITAAFSSKTSLRTLAVKRELTACTDKELIDQRRGGGMFRLLVHPHPAF